jgi:hypothetical protein
VESGGPVQAHVHVMHRALPEERPVNVTGQRLDVTFLRCYGISSVGRLAREDCFTLMFLVALLVERA